MTTNRAAIDTTALTIVLVHGALTDASVWIAVANDLRNKGHRVFCPALPLGGLSTDAEYLASVLDGFSGPLILVGHSYAGSVISHPLLSRPNIRALVYIAAFMPEAGESAGELNARLTGSLLGPETIEVRSYPGGKETSLRPDRFGEVYAHDLDRSIAATMASAQRPIDANALAESFNEAPLWKQVPSWALIGTKDCSLQCEVQRMMARRARAHSAEVESSHASRYPNP